MGGEGGSQTSAGAISAQDQLAGRQSEGRNRGKTRVKGCRSRIFGGQRIVDPNHLATPRARQPAQQSAVSEIAARDIGAAMKPDQRLALRLGAFFRHNLQPIVVVRGSAHPNA